MTFEGKKFFRTLGAVAGAGALGTAGKRGFEISSTFKEIAIWQEKLDAAYDVYFKSEPWDQVLIRLMYINPAEHYIEELKAETSFFNDVSAFDDYAAYLAAGAALFFFTASCFKRTATPSPQKA